MGILIKKTSKKTAKSFLYLLNKVVTLLFALFCVITGKERVNNIVNSRQSQKYSIKGRVYSSVDSTLLKGINVMLEGIEYPLYGMGSGPYYQTIDTNETDEGGLFNFNSSDTMEWFWNDYRISTVGHNTINDTSYLPYSEEIHFNGLDKDTIIDIYLTPEKVNNVSKINAKENKEFEVINSNNLIIRYKNWNGNIASISKIYNLKGEIVEDIKVSPEGELVWKTNGVAKGAYFIKTPFERGTNTVKVIVK